MIETSQRDRALDPSDETIGAIEDNLERDAAAALFQVVSQRHLKTSIVLTTNRGIADWGQIFEDTTVAAAILDRLLHHATVLSITGDSYRMRRHRDAIATLRPALTGRPHDGEFS